MKNFILPFKNKFFYCFIFFANIFNSNSLFAQISGFKKIVTDIGISNNGTQAMILQPDNKTISCGFITEGGQGKIAFYRLDSLGNLDPSFGKNGTSIFYNFLPSPYQGATISAIALQPDGKIIAAGTAFYQPGSSFESNILVMRLNTNGSIDSSFGQNGTVRTNIFSINGGSIDDAYSVLAGPDGKIIIGGTSYDLIQRRMLFIRYLSNGQLDPSFSNDGIVLIDINHRDDRIFDMVLQPNGKIIGAGEYYNTTSSWDVALVRLSANGIPDNTFGNNGIVLNTIGLGGDMAKKLSLQTDGKIIIAGTTKISQQSSDNILAIRYKKEGTIDSSFATNGIYIKDISNDNDVANSLQIQTDNKIIIGGYTAQNAINNFLTIRLDTKGKPDAGFGVNGILSHTFFSQGDISNALVLQTNGKIIQAGQTANGASSFFSNIRYTSNGLLDNLYANAGIKVFSLSSSDDKADRIVKLPWDNTLLVFGNANDYWALANYKLNLSLNTSFGLNGIQSLKYLDMGGTTTTNHEIAIDSALQKIYICGKTDKEGSFMIRLNKNGSLDTTFGNKGMVNYLFSIYYGGLAVLPNHKIVVGGLLQFGGLGAVINRFNTNGTLDSTFGSNGQIKNLPIVSNSIINDNKYNRILVSGKTSNSGVGVMAIKNNGDLDSSFGINGVGSKKVPGGGITQSYFKYNLTQDPYGRIIVCGGVQSGSFNLVFSVTRFLNNGEPDTTFGNGGMVVTNTGIAPYSDSHNEGISGNCINKDNCSVVTAGIAINDQNEKSKFIIIAYDNNGSIDSLHNSPVYIDTSFLGDEYEGGYAALFDKDVIYFAGKAGKKNKNDFLLLKEDLKINRPEKIQPVQVDYVLTVSPNPAQKYLQVSYRIAQTEKVKFQLVSLNGNAIYNLLEQTVAAGAQQAKIILPSNIPKGMYELKMISLKGVNSKMILVN